MEVSGLQSYCDDQLNCYQSQPFTMDSHSSETELLKTPNGSIRDSIPEFKNHLRLLLEFLKNNKMNPASTKPKTYRQKIEKFKNKFDQYHETTTPKSVLSKSYNCTGRLKFYSDKMLYIYLEIAEKPRMQTLCTFMWPVKLTWKVDIIDEDDEDDTAKCCCLGQATSIFNKPKQGFVSFPSDWIAKDFNAIDIPKVLADDGSVTLRWTVITEPLLPGVYVEDFQKLLEKLEVICNNYEGPEVLLSHIKKAAHEILEERKEQGKKIDVLEHKLVRIESNLQNIEHEQKAFRKIFEDFVSETKPLN